VSAETLPFEVVKNYYEMRCVEDTDTTLDTPTIMDTWLKSEFKIDIVRDFQNPELVRKVFEKKESQKSVLNINYVVRIGNYYSECKPHGTWKAAWRRQKSVTDSSLFEADFRMIKAIDYVTGILCLLTREVIVQMYRFTPK
jgi:hypothetical protein